MRHTRTGTSQGWQAMAASLALALVLAAPAPAQTARAIAPVVAPVAGVVSSGAAPSLSERAAQNLDEEITLLGAVKMKTVEEAQGAIVRVIRALEESGQVVVTRGTDEYVS